MDLLTIAIVLAAALPALSLVFGVVTMATHRPVAHGTGQQWMVRRVAFQLLAVALLLFAWLAS
ncbi:MAG TPA: hypothetical protein P5163_06090 [Rubrivivax sp.]|nr:hypothetical protein [Rubrivivax sp.]HOW46776.1 hypothetical protein [Rubrivivax sp.]HRY86648.1 hypothetical protein [Rubrivivax sp.]HRZ60148.1 hypothetical protein [Rubrivivax sp.]